MGKVVGYGCVASSQHSVKENRFLSEEEALWRQNTKASEEFKKLHNLFLPEDSILIDVIGGSYRRRHNLDNCLASMGYGDSIVISSLSSLGLNIKELLENYKKIYKAGIGLLLPDYSREDGVSIYSTTNFGFDAVKMSDEEFNNLCDMLAGENIKSKRGRKTIKLTEEFKEIYWLYEKYAIDPITACKNKYFDISKNTFRKLADKYEVSDDYSDALEYYEKGWKISGLPKRHGVIDEITVELIRDVDERGISFETASITRGLKIHKLQFYRLLLKHYCPKGAVLKKTFELRDFDLIESLQPNYDKT